MKRQIIQLPKGAFFIKESILPLGKLQTHLFQGYKITSVLYPNGVRILVSKRIHWSYGPKQLEKRKLIAVL